MQRRTQAFLLILFGLVIIVGVVIWLFLSWRAVQPNIVQPPAYPEGQVQTGDIPVEPTPTPPAPTDPALLESRRTEDKLRRMAQEFVSRAGTYSNTDEFAALRDVGLDATPAVRTFFLAEQTRLREAYPFRNGTWGQTVRGLASKVLSPTPIRPQTDVIVQVDAQVLVSLGNAQPTTSYRSARVTFQPSGPNWLVSRLDWVEVE